MNTRDRMILLGAGIVVLLSLLVGPFLLMTAMCPGCMTLPGPMGNMMGSPGSMMGGMVLMLAAGALVLVGAVLLVIWGITKLAQPASRSTPEGPLSELQARYARGEITREEYEQIRDDLRRDHAA